MAVLTRPCSVFPCLRQTCRSGASRNGMILKKNVIKLRSIFYYYQFTDLLKDSEQIIRSLCSTIKTHLCTVAVSLTLFNSARLPREAFRYGAVPYLVVYSVWLLLVGLATTLLQLAMGQLSQQDAIGVWRAVPIMRGVGHIQLLTSYLCCVYSLIYLGLAAAYMMWIGKDELPLRACTRLQMTPNGYENKINASECFNITFLSPFEQHPQYLGIMAIITFVLWFFIPLLLYGLKKSYKITSSILTPIILIIAIVLATFLSKVSSLEPLLLSCEHWSVFTEPKIWFSSLVQALLSTQILSGHLVSAGGTIYKHSDVRWVSTTLVFYNLLAGWLWVLLWQSIGGESDKETGFMSVMALIYQSSITEGRAKYWPIIAFGLLLASGVLTIITLLYPIYDRLQRFTGDKWKLVAGIGSAAGTCLTLGVLIRALDIATLLDDLVLPVMVVFSTTLQVLGFVFIYGCRSLRIDIDFLTGIKASSAWVVFWCLTPAFLVGFTGWWLRELLRETDSMYTLWPLGGALVAMLIIMAVVAAIAVAKEEQFNLLSKMASAFRPSRLWGPEDPTVRYNWMVQRYTNDRISDEESVASYTYPHTISNNINEKHWSNDNDMYQRSYNIYTNHFPKPQESMINYATYALPKKKRQTETKFISPNICIANNELDSRLECNCNRHFTLNVPYMMTNEVTTSL